MTINGITAAEIAYNLTIMEKAQQNGATIDKGFIGIFSKDVQALVAQNGNIAEVEPLRKRIVAIAMKMAKDPVPSSRGTATTQSKKIDQDNRPFVESPSDLQRLADSYVPGPVRDGLIKLNPQLQMRAIRGDGHCLFRAILTAFVVKWVDMNQEAKKEKVDHLSEQLLPYDPALDKKFQEFKRILYRLTLKKYSTEDVLNNEEISNKMIALLRQASCHYNKTKAESKYLSDMADMQRAVYGTSLEIEALSALLGIDIVIHDVKAAGEGKSNYSYTIGSHHNTDSIHLLHRPGHYDLALPK